MEVKGNVIIHGSYIDIHDNDVVNLSVDKADVKVNGKNITEIEKENKNSTSENVIGENQEIPETSPESVKECFRFVSDYVRQQVNAIVAEFYLGQAVNLAMMEVTLYDHGQLQKRNSHKLFVRALIDWDILPKDTDINKTSTGMASKLRSTFPTEGYKQWDKFHLNEKNLCTNIGNRLPESMKYNRNE